jgi:hypothetical protein
MAPKKGTTRPSGNIAKAPAPAAKSSPAPIVKDSKGNIDPRYGKKIQQEQGVAKAVKQYSSPIGPKVPSNKTQLLQRSQQMRKENEKKKGKGKGSGSGSGSNANKANLPLDTGLDDDLDLGGSGGGGGDYQEYSPVARSIKIPDRDAIIALQRDGADQALITAILFEQIGATELVKFTRNDTIDGLNGVYDVISNISELKTKLDPSYLISKQRPDVTIDNGFSIRLQDKLPSIDYLFENEIPNYVHFDSTIGDGGSLVIELDNLDTDEIIEVEIDTSGTIEEVRQ